MGMPWLFCRENGESLLGVTKLFTKKSLQSNALALELESRLLLENSEEVSVVFVSGCPNDLDKCLGRGISKRGSLKPLSHKAYAFLVAAGDSGGDVDLLATCAPFRRLLESSFLHQRVRLLFPLGFQTERVRLRLCESCF